MGKWRSAATLAPCRAACVLSPRCYVRRAKSACLDHRRSLIGQPIRGPIARDEHAHSLWGAPRCWRGAKCEGAADSKWSLRQALAVDRVARSSMAEMMPSQIAIVGSLLVGLAATLGTIVIHGFVVHTIVMTVRQNLRRGVLGMRIWVNLTFVMGATLLALAGHLGEIALWAFVLDISGAVADISAAIYSSAGSYTTVGSNIVLPPQWKLRGHLKLLPEC